jgi:hypothetical protein
MKSSPGEQSKFTPLGIERLYAPHVGGHQADSCVKDTLISSFNFGLSTQTLGPAGRLSKRSM